MAFPRVIWAGSQPLHKSHVERFRLVQRPEARPGHPEDVPFGVEQRVGLSEMGRLNWGSIKDDKQTLREAIYALSHAFGKVLVSDPKDLIAGHPINCEVNLAIIEGREAIGCDCHGPDEPEGQVRPQIERRQ